MRLVLAGALSVLLLGGPVWADQTQAQSDQQAQQPAQQAEQPMTEATVQAVDEAAKQITLDSGHTLVVDEATAITKAGGPAQLEDLKEGTKIRASFEEKDGQTVATLIEITPEG